MIPRSRIELSFPFAFLSKRSNPIATKPEKSQNFEINRSRFYLFNVCFPPTSIRTNKDAKNNKVLHSTRAIRPSKSSLSAKINSNRTPNRAVQPNDKCRFGTLCTKNNVITKINVNPDFTNSHLSLIGYCNKINIEYVYIQLRYDNKYIFNILPFPEVPRA